MHFIDLAVTNAWILYRQDKHKLRVPRKNIQKYLDFRLEIADIYSTAWEESRRGSSCEDDEPASKVSRQSNKVVALPSISRRLLGATHLPQMMAANTTSQMRCRNENCTKKTLVKCVACNVFLCLRSERNCFADFHTE